MTYKIRTYRWRGFGGMEVMLHTFPKTGKRPILYNSTDGAMYFSRSGAAHVLWTLRNWGYRFTRQEGRENA
jgi:hypothetical protein